MRANRFLAAVAMIALASCSASSTPGSAASLAPQGYLPSPSASTITGFVESYGENDIRLLTDGVEVRLIGAIQEVIPHGGLQVTVSGRQIDPDRFWVAEVIASTPARNPVAHAHAW
jgi:hypothetical protein